DVSVRDRDVFSAAVVRHWTRIGARAIRADLQTAHGVDARYRAAAGADSVDVEHRQRDRTHVDLTLRGDYWIALMDQRDIATRATHVEGDDVVDADALAGTH